MRSETAKGVKKVFSVEEVASLGPIKNNYRKNDFGSS